MSDHGIDDSFAAYPPNALLSLVEDERANDVVAVLSDPVTGYGDLSYAVEATDGDLAPSTGSVSSFIDLVGRPLTPVSVVAECADGSRRGLLR